MGLEAYRFVALRLTKRLSMLLRVAKMRTPSYKLIDKSVEFYGNGDLLDRSSGPL